MLACRRLAELGTDFGPVIVAVKKKDVANSIHFRLLIEISPAGELIREIEMARG